MGSGMVVAPFTPHNEGFIYRAVNNAPFTIHLFRRCFNPKHIIMDIEVQTQNPLGEEHPEPGSIWPLRGIHVRNAFLQGSFPLTFTCETEPLL